MTSPRLLSLMLLLSTAVLPASAFALEGIGPRSTFTGFIEQVFISEKQAFDQEGAELAMKASNGQMVNVVITRETKIISEGRMSRKDMIPANLVPGMQIRVRGLRVNSNSLTASLIVIMNIELNPVLSQNGILSAIDGSVITVLGSDGRSRSFSLTNETEVNLNYTSYGVGAMNLIGKQVLLTLNPRDAKLVRILRVTGDKPLVRTSKPTTIDLGVRTID